MKNNIFGTIFLCLALSAKAQQAIVCDVAKLNSFTASITATVDTDVTATILQNGVESPLAGYTGLFYFGDSLGGVTITNSATGYNTFSWTIPAESTPTNGVYSVQILSAKDGRVKELGRGRMTVRANPSTDYIPVQWQTNNMAYMTAALARDIAIQANNTASNALVIANQALGNSSMGTNDVLSLSGGLLAVHNTNTDSHLDVRQTASNGLANANEALARENVTTNAVNDLAGVIVSNHNLSASAHEDIRADVSNAVESISLSVKTNSVGGVEVGTDCVASGKHSMAFGYGAIASGVGSRSIGYFTSAIGNYSIAEGSGTTASGNNSRAFGQGSIAAGAGAFAAGLYSEASGTYSISLGYAGISSGYCSFVWSGYGDGMMGYSSHGDDTFNINPVNSASGFFIGETNLQTFLDARVSVSDFASSNAVTQASINGKLSTNGNGSALSGITASQVGAMSTSERTNYYTKAEADMVGFYKPITDSASSVTSTVSVVPSVSIYRLTATNSTTITFDTSALNTTNQLATWELWVLNASTNNSIIWPSTNSVYYIANPSSINANSQTVYTVWRKFGDTVQCNPYLVK